MGAAGNGKFRLDIRAFEIERSKTRPLSKAATTRKPSSSLHTTASIVPKQMWSAVSDSRMLRGSLTKLQ